MIFTSFCLFCMCLIWLRSPRVHSKTRAKVLADADVTGPYVPCLFYGQADPASTPEVAGCVPAQVRGSGSSDTPGIPGTRDPDGYRYSMLQTRCARLEQDLRATQGVQAVLKSTQSRPAEREAFLFDELERASCDLLCKLLRAPEPSSFSSCSDYFCSLLLQAFSWMPGLRPTE